jgi:hypothetical protein
MTEKAKQKANGKKALTASEVAEIYSLNEGTLANLRAQKRGPRFCKSGRKVLYFAQDVETYLLSGAVLTSDALPEHRCKCEL